MASDGGAPGGVFPPTAFDDYEVVRPLGRGGMGAVYLGHDAMLDRPVALKFIAAADPNHKHRERFLNEARAIARLQHPNVVGVYRIGEVARRPYLAYEFIDGADLHTLPKPVRWPTALAIGIGAARGLSAAHRRGVLHRDVKPANIMVTATGEVKLLDFGLAKLVDAEQESAGAIGAPSRGSEITSAGSIAGTPLYMAPELWRGEQATAPADVFALGLVLYELVAGALPHAGLTGQDLVDVIQRRDLPPVGDRQPDAPRALCDVIMRCTRRHAADRFASADEVRDALEAVHAYYQPFGDTGAVRGGAPSDDATRVGDSFARVVRDASDEFPRRFYHHLFERAPAVRSMFPADMSSQHLKLLGSLKLIVRQLHEPADLVPFLEELGTRHAGYGVEPQHFEVFAGALIDTLRSLEGPDWSDSLEDAWRFACARIAQTMVRAIDQHRRGATATVRSRAPALFEVPLAPPRTRLAQNGDLPVPYQVLGDGPIDLLLLPASGWQLELSWQDPRAAAFLRKLASCVRLILVEGHDAASPDRSVEELMRDECAVLDALASERAFVLGLDDGCALAAAFAATYTERARGVILYGSESLDLVRELLPLIDVPSLLLARRGESFDADAQQVLSEVEVFVKDPAVLASGRAHDLRFLATVLAIGAEGDASSGARATFAREVARRHGALIDRTPAEVCVAVFDGPSPARECAATVLAQHPGSRAVIHAGECRIEGGDLAGPAIDEALAALTRAPAGQVEVTALAQRLGHRG